MMCTAFPAASMWAMVALALIAAGAPICALRAKSGGICATARTGSAASAIPLPRSESILMGFPRRGERDKIRSAIARARPTPFAEKSHQTEYRGDQHGTKLLAFATVVQ